MPTDANMSSELFFLYVVTQNRPKIAINFAWFGIVLIILASLLLFDKRILVSCRGKELSK